MDIKKMTDQQLQKKFDQIRKKVLNDTKIDSIELDRQIDYLGKLSKELKKRSHEKN